MKGVKNLPQVNLRLPPEMKEKLQESAQQGFRSLNNEIVKRLMESISQEKQNATQ
ncbi:Arc family DNA-binding protein [Undibacterium sp.]|uniref:Arc family DNA-binding protein n=1 Tax=Undibacterium sp. TaxID=1914977 RepID=UPI00374DEFB9